MNATATTQDGVVHVFANGQFDPPIVVPVHIHERLLRNINETRRREADSRKDTA